MKPYHRKEFTPEENKKLNEIFKELDDDEEDNQHDYTKGVFMQTDTVIIPIKKLLSSVD